MADVRAPIVAVIAGTGGVGASSLTCALAVTAHAGLLVDLDSCGGGLDTLLGIEGVGGARWSGLHVAGGALDPVDLSRGLPRWRGVCVLAADGSVPSAPTVRAVLAAGRRLGPVVIDAGRCLCDDQVSLLRECDLVLIVAEGEPRGVAATRAVADRLDGATSAVVLRRGSLTTTEVRALVRLPVIGNLPPLGRRTGVRIPRSMHRIAAAVVDGLTTSPTALSVSSARP